MLWLLSSIAPAFATGPDAQYLDCDEFAGVGVVPTDAISALVPAPFVPLSFPATDDEGNVIVDENGAPVLFLSTVVAQGGRCDEIIASGISLHDRIFAQFGVGIVPPPGFENGGNFYQLAFATDHLLLALELRSTGANARWTPFFLSYELTPTNPGEADFELVFPRPFDFAFLLDGPVVLPDPHEAPQPVTTFNYWVQSPTDGNVVQSNVVTGIRFGEGSQVELTAFGSSIESIVGTDPFSFPFFSNPEIFDQADVTITTNAF
ncbi:MAG: hypothetical protein AAGA48_00185 [Myxococcota bacterium]